jgi:hypothetical protein
VRPAVEAEKLGIPSVVVTLTGFTRVAHQAAKAMGIPGLRIAEYPGAVGVHPEDLVRKNVESVLFDRIVDGLTNSSAAGDTLVAPSKPAEVAFRGDDEAAQEFFRRQLWTDDLPIIPPTRERVEAFLRHTGRKPDEPTAVLPQANLVATPRNIAANGVMAGCRPEHMPILIAAVEAIADERYNLNNIGTTWGVLPYLLVNGPIVKELGLEYGGQLISKGPNPALGAPLA